MKINQWFIPVSFTKTRPGIKMTPRYITIHETDNTAKGANDEAHAKLQANGNPREASWHYQVDDNSIWQSLPDNEVGWHAGDGRGPGNMTSIGIEICVNSDGNYKKACENAAWLVRHLMAKHFIPINFVVQHNYWSGKNCPRHLRAGDWGLNWNGFINLVKEQPKPQEVEYLMEKAVVCNGLADLGNAELVAAKVQAPIVFREYTKGQKVAKTVYIIGGANDTSLGQTVVHLAGADRFATADAVKNFLRK